MGDLINFGDYKKKRATGAGAIRSTAHEESSTPDVGWLKAAQDISRDIGHRFRFFVMREGLPENEQVLCTILKRLRAALNPLAAEFGASALYNLLGVRVYFSQNKTEYKIADGGFRSLYLNNDFSEKEVDELIRPLLQAMSPAQRIADTSLMNLTLGDGHNPNDLK